MYRRIAPLFLGLIVFGSPASAPVAAKPPENRPEIEVTGDWGGGSREDVTKVLQSVADQLLAHCPDRKLAKIIVSPSDDVPISLYKKGPNGEYRVQLSARETYWAQYAFQFAHEMGHILCNYDRRKAGVNLWFEECLCDTSSMFVLQKLKPAWEQEPPYPNWKGFAPAFAKYRDNLLKPDDRRLADGVTLPAWLKDNLIGMTKERELTARSKLVSGYLVPLFDEHPEGWQTLAWINLGEQDRDADFATFLQGWHDRLPEKHRPFVEKIQTLSGHVR